MSRKSKSKAPHVPPTTVVGGTTEILAVVVPVFDGADGEGADWRLMTESLFLAAFQTLGRLPESDRLTLANRIQAGVYERFLSAEASFMPEVERGAKPAAAPAAKRAFSPKGPA